MKAKAFHVKMAVYACSDGCDSDCRVKKKQTCKRNAVHVICDANLVIGNEASACVLILIKGDLLNTTAQSFSALGWINLRSVFWYMTVRHLE